MKRSLLLLLLLPLTACDMLLSLDEEPRSFLSEEQFFRTADDANAAVVAIYEPFRELGYYNRHMLVIPEGLADHADSRAFTIASWACDSRCIGYMGDAWSSIYSSISRANLALARIPEIEMDAEQKAQLLAEARFLRAFNYLNLVRYWGGVPLRTEPVTDLTDPSIPRASADEVYQLIISDLTEAEAALPDIRPAAEEGRPTRWAATGLLADIYLGLEDWAQAAAKAEEVIHSGRYSLIEVSQPLDFDQKLFGADVQLSPENIHVIKFMRLPGLGFQIPAMLHHPDAGYSAVGWRGVHGDPASWMGAWDTQDMRREYTLYVGEDEQYLSAPEPIRFKKYMDAEASDASGHGNDFPILRYADMLLIYAEAVNQLSGPTAPAYDAVNQVRRRAYGVPLALAAPGVDLAEGLSREAFRDAILRERAKEFVAEGKRFWDLKRTGRAAEKIEAVGEHFDPKLLAWIIPQEELDTNDALTNADQNPGW